MHRKIHENIEKTLDFACFLNKIKGISVVTQRGFEPRRSVVKSLENHGFFKSLAFSLAIRFKKYSSIRFAASISPSSMICW